VAPVAILVGLAMEVLKYLNLLVWPWLEAKLRREYGPFYISVSIVLFSFLAAMLVLAGAEWAARENPEMSQAGHPESLTDRASPISQDSSRIDLSNSHEELEKDR